MVEIKKYLSATVHMWNQFWQTFPRNCHFESWFFVTVRPENCKISSNPKFRTSKMIILLTFKLPKPISWKIQVEEKSKNFHTVHGTAIKTSCFIEHQVGFFGSSTSHRRRLTKRNFENAFWIGLISIQIRFINKMFKINGLQVNSFIKKDIIRPLGIIGSSPGLLHAIQHAVQVVVTADTGRYAVNSDDGGAHMMGMQWGQAHATILFGQGLGQGRPVKATMAAGSFADVTSCSGCWTSGLRGSVAALTNPKFFSLMKNFWKTKEMIEFR